MDWRVVLVLCAVGVVLLVVTVLGAMLGRRKKQVGELRAEVEQWKGRAHNMRDEVERLVALREYEGMSDDEAIKTLREKLAGWSPVDRDDGDGGGGST